MIALPRLGLLVLVSVAACDSGDDPINYEVLFDDDFATFPDGYVFGAVPHPAHEADFGFPAPSGMVGGHVAPPAAFSIARQAFDVGVGAYLQQNGSYGDQHARLLVSRKNAANTPPLLAMVTYRLVINYSNGVPLAGYPGGATAEIICQLGTSPPVMVPVPYVERDTMYELFIDSTPTGARCGFDDTVVSMIPSTILEQGEFGVGIMGNDQLTNDNDVAWFDNLRVRREAL